MALPAFRGGVAFFVCIVSEQKYLHIVFDGYITTQPKCPLEIKACLNISVLHLFVPPLDAAVIIATH